MNIIVNSGSSSLKYKIFDGTKVVEEKTFENLKYLADYQKKLRELRRQFKINKTNIQDIKFIGHRIVHGGELKSPFILKTYRDFAKLDQYNRLAPLHNPLAVNLVKTCQILFPKSQNIAFFDTDFFQHLPILSYIYPLNYTLAEKLKIRKYGFHGISHKYTQRIVDPKKQLKIISIHLGSGCSITAINKGQAVETSMGFTPLDGLMMQTRSGSIDPGIIFFLIKRLGIKYTEDLILRNSGLAGLSGTTGDMKTLLTLAGQKVNDDVVLDYKLAKNRGKFEDRAKLAIDKFVYEIRKMIGAYDVVLNGSDIIAFTGKIGFGSEYLRREILKNNSLVKEKKFAAIEPNEEFEINQQLLEKGYL